MSRTDELVEQERIRDTVRTGYAATALQSGGSCCGKNAPDQLARSIGYAAEELDALPAGANMGLSCGNPVALGQLQEGETVVDLGSGGGFDVFIAGRKVGPTGRAIGIDMTPEMLAKARRNSIAYAERTGFDNVEFRLGEIEHLPLADNSVDVVLSNCVINLSPDKPRVWREIGRVLKPGGRVAVSDIVLKKPLPDALRDNAQALVGCVAGALLQEEVVEAIQHAGLVDVRLEEKPGYVQAMAESKADIHARVTMALPGGTEIGDFIASMDISARKPDEAERPE